MEHNQEQFTVESIPAMRRFALDAGYLGRKRHMVHGLIEVDVTAVREYLREYKARTGESLSFTAFIIYCLGQAISENPHLHAYRNWRNQLVIFADININSKEEKDRNGRKIAMPHVFKAVNRKSFLDIHREIRATKEKPAQTAESNFMGWFLRLPAFIRHLFYWFVMRTPQRFRAYSSSVMVTAVGMFGQGGGWGITLPNFTLTVVVGGIAKKPGVVADQIAIREFLDLTISVDHDIVDGAPAARFANSFRQLIESGAGLLPENS